MLRLTDKIIEEYNMLSGCKTLVAAVSGGADSVCMLHILQRVCRSRNIDLVCAHFNHRLRGLDSDKDQQYVKKLCEELNIRFFTSGEDVEKLSKEHGISLETAAREARYKFLNSIAEEFENSKIATAHTANDNAETVLLNLIRGTGIKGLCGIPPCRDNIIRPILLFTRNDTETYCKDNSLEYVTDHTNFDTKYSRNKIRLQVLPLLSEINSDAVKNICKAAALLEKDENFLNEASQALYDNAFSNSSLSLELLRKAEDVLVARVLIRFIKENTLCDYDSTHINEAVSLVKKGRTGNRIQLRKDVFLEISYDRLIITNNASVFVPNLVEISGPGDYCFGKYTVMLREGYNKNKKNLLDYDKLSFPITLRSPQSSDRFKIPSVGTKAVNRLLIDRKIPRGERGQLPVLVKDMQVIWIDKVGASENFRVNNNTNKYIHIIIKENIQ